MRLAGVPCSRYAVTLLRVAPSSYRAPRFGDWVREEGAWSAGLYTALGSAAQARGWSKRCWVEGGWVGLCGFGEDGYWYRPSGSGESPRLKARSVGSVCAPVGVLGPLALARRFPGRRRATAMLHAHVAECAGSSSEPVVATRPTCIAVAWSRRPRGAGFSHCDPGSMVVRRVLRVASHEVFRVLRVWRGLPTKGTGQGPGASESGYAHNHVAWRGEARVPSGRVCNVGPVDVRRRASRSAAARPRVQEGDKE